MSDAAITGMPEVDGMTPSQAFHAGRKSAAAEIERLRAWAKDEQQKREAVEEDRLRERQENERLRAALEPFAKVARWAERNGHDLLKGWDMLLRQPDGGFAGHLQAQSPDFIAALAALNNQQQADKT